MLIEKGYPSYNSRRYGRPWGARITFPDGITPKFDFVGRWDGRDGNSGNVVLEAEPGEVLAFGQKDIRAGRNTERDLYIVQDDGALVRVSEAEARTHWRAHTTQEAARVYDENLAVMERSALHAFTDEQLLAELRRRGRL